MPSFNHTRKRSRTRIFSATLAGIVAASALLAVPAHGDDLSWGINPGGTEQRSSFSYELEAGDEVTDSFQITNYGTAAIDLSVYGADGVTSSNGALELLPSSTASNYIGAWIAVEEQKITLAAGEETEVGFTLSVPEDVEPGDYVGGMISSHVSSSDSTVAVDQRLATQLAVRVGGEGGVAIQVVDASASAPIAWNPFVPVEATAHATMINDGNLRARGPYTLTISGPFGLGKTSQTFSAAETLPGSTVQVEQQVPGLWPLIWHKVEVTMNAEGIDSMPAEPSTASATFWAIPAGWIGILLLVIVAGLIIGVRRARNWVYEDEEAGEENLYDTEPTK